MPKISKIIALILVFCVGTQTVFADWSSAFKKGWDSGKASQFWDNKGFSNFTDSVINKTGNNYGGSYIAPSGSYRFTDDNSSYSPWLDWEAPSIDADCNGLNFSLGFANLVDFDDIADNLGNVSSAIVFGVIVAIINSVPTINQAFSQIKALVQYIQNLLRNACNFSKNITENLIGQGQEWIKDKSNQPGASFGIKVANFMANAQDYVDSGSNLVNKSLSKFTQTMKDSLKGKKSSASDSGKKLAAEYEQMANTIFRVGLIPSILIDSYLPVTNQDNTVYPDKNEFKLITVSQANLSDPKFIYLLTVNVLGDPEAINPNSLKDLFATPSGSSKSVLEFLMKLIKDGSVDSSYDKVIEMVAQQQYKGLKEGFSLEPIEPNLVAGDKDFSFVETLFGGGTLKLKPQRIVVAQVKSANNKIYQLFKTVGKTDEEAVEIKWDGLVEESKKAIYCAIKSRSSGDTHSESALGVLGDIMGTGNVTCSNQSRSGDYILMTPNYNRDLNVLVGLIVDYIRDKKNNLAKSNITRAKVKSYAELLAMKNAYYYIQYFIAVIDDVYKKSPIQKEDKQRKILEENRKKLQEKADTIFKEVKENVSNYNNMEKMNEDIEKNTNAKTIK